MFRFFKSTYIYSYSYSTGCHLEMSDVSSSTLTSLMDAIFMSIPYNQVTIEIHPLPFNIMNFLSWVQESISMFTLTLGRDDESMVDEIIMAILTYSMIY